MRDESSLKGRRQKSPAAVQMLNATWPFSGATLRINVTSGNDLRILQYSSLYIFHTPHSFHSLHSTSRTLNLGGKNDKIQVWHKVVSHKTILLTKTFEPLVDAFFVPNHDTLTLQMNVLIVFLESF